ncbi:MAG: hypothetical protein HXS48_25745 [Theionarchaea archaeon]|nr:MAG: hypothetical protein AYK19_13600 [Theionarchaea archaeon DG-70-1]MBU7030362.1 hypothetical protein [Theionarchaea archaeon]
MAGLLFILVEGNDDERFFKRIINPVFQEKYSSVRLWKYSKKKLEKTKRFIKSIKSMNADYIYTADINEAPCITFKKEDVIQKSGIEEDKIIIVVKEVEGWYLAGLSAENSKRLGISEIKDTNKTTKEDFNRLIPKKSSLEYYLWKEF